MMPWVDLMIIGIIALSVITGMIRGFVKELVALCIWALAIWVAYHYSDNLDPWLQHYIQDKTARTVASFVLLLLATLISGGILNALLSMILKRSGLSGTDRLLGMGFGFVRGIFIVAMIITVIKMTSLPVTHYSKESQLYAKFDPVVSWLHGLSLGVIKRVKVLDEGNQVVDIQSRTELMNG